MGFIRSAFIHYCGLSLVLEQVAAQPDCSTTGLLGPNEVSALSDKCWDEACSAKEVNGVGFIPTEIDTTTCGTMGTASITGNLKINTNAASDRFDVGFGVGPFPNPDTAAGGFLCDVYGFTCTNADADGDICADFLEDASLFEDIAFEVPCQFDDDGRVVVNYCVSWKTKGGQNTACSGVDEIFPNPTAKCQCGDVTVPNCPDPETVSLSFGIISVPGETCTDPTTYDVRIDGVIPAGYEAVFIIKDAADVQVTGTTTSGNVISAPLIPGASYTIEATLTEEVDGVTLECPAITLDLGPVPVCCADDDNVCTGDGEICCPKKKVCEVPIAGSDPAACGDPHMTGFLGQKFDFTGEDSGWYCLIKDDNMQVSMRVTTPVPSLPEITYITGLSVLTTDVDGSEHDIVIEVRDPYSLESSCPTGVSPCLADGALAVVLDGEETLLAPGTVSLGLDVAVSAVNLPGACRSFGFDKYWEMKALESATVGRRLREEAGMGEWILADPTATNMDECIEYVARAETEAGGVFAHQSEHALFQILTPKASIRLSHGRLHQVAMRDPTDQYDLPEHDTWQMNFAVDHKEVSHAATGILGETFVPTLDSDGNPIMSGMEAIRGTQDDYRVDGPLGVDFVQNTRAL